MPIDDFLATMKAEVRLMRRAFPVLEPLHNVGSEPTLWGEKDFVLRNGREYFPAVRPPGLKKGRNPHACFQNCMQVLHDRTDLIYVEGYVCLSPPYIPLAVHHAWLVKPGSRQAIDVTFDEVRYYYGVPFKRDRVLFQWKVADRTQMLPVISDWNNGSPVLAMSYEELQSIIQE